MLNKTVKLLSAIRLLMTGRCASTLTAGQQPIMPPAAPVIPRSLSSLSLPDAIIWLFDPESTKRQYNFGRCRVISINSA